MPWILARAHLGAGPGITSDLLRAQVEHLTLIEADPELAGSLRLRMRSTNVAVVSGDAAAMPFPDAVFSGCAAYTMLHHVPSPELQDAVLREMWRVLRPGGEVAGSDSLPNAFMRLIHLGDTFVPVNPDSFAARLEAAGFEVIQVDRTSGLFRFHARRPQEPRARRTRQGVRNKVDEIHSTSRRRGWLTQEETS